YSEPGYGCCALIVELEITLTGLSINVTCPSAPALLFVTATSGKLLFVNTPATNAVGFVLACSSTALVNSPLPRSAKTMPVPALVLATAIPPLPCWVKSAIATPVGVALVASGDCDDAKNVPSPLPR